MNILQEEKALERLPPQKYTIRILVMAVCSLFGLLVGVGKYAANEIKRLQTSNTQCNTEKQNILERWRLEGAESVRRSEEDKRKADSILMIVIMTKSTIKKAIKHEKSK